MFVVKRGIKSRLTYYELLLDSKNCHILINPTL